MPSCARPPRKLYLGIRLLMPWRGSFPRFSLLQTGLEFNIRIPSGWLIAGFEFMERTGRAASPRQTIVSPYFQGICSTRNVARKQLRRSNGLDAASNRDDCCATPGFSKEETPLRAKLCAAVG